MADFKSKPNSQHIVVEGRLGADPDMLEVGNTDLTDFSLATNVYQGPNKDVRTDWYRVKLWGHMAKLGEYLSVGDKVVVMGEPGIRQYETEDGETRYSFEINARNLVFAGTAATRGGNETQGGKRKARKKKKKKASSKGEGDMPF